jgi:hypothetical protein
MTSRKNFTVLATKLKKTIMEVLCTLVVEQFFSTEFLVVLFLAEKLKYGKIFKEIL